MLSKINHQDHRILVAKDNRDDKKVVTQSYVISERRFD